MQSFLVYSTFAFRFTVHPMDSDIAFQPVFCKDYELSGAPFRSLKPKQRNDKLHLAKEYTVANRLWKNCHKPKQRNECWQVRKQTLVQ